MISEQFGSNKKTILVVDDDADFVETIAIDLKEMGYEVVKTYSGEECLTTIEKSMPDLLILDFMMPGMDGAEVLQRLRTKEIGIPIILLTAAHPRQMEDKASQYNAEYIAKIYKFDKLQSTVQRFLGIK
jgi:CheY-like chemotaxis protein